MGTIDTDISSQVQTFSNVNSILKSSFQNVSISLDAVALVFCVFLLGLFLWMGFKVKRKISSLEKDLAVFIKFSKISHQEEV